MEREIRIEPTQHKSHGPCPHCGGEEQSVWGWVHRGRGTRAVYYVRWTAGRPAEGMTWMLCVGPWGGGADDAARRSVGLRARIVKRCPLFMVIDAVDTPWGCQRSPIFGSLLTRTEVVDTPLAQEIFGYVDRPPLVVGVAPRLPARYLATRWAPASSPMARPSDAAGGRRAREAREHEHRQADGHAEAEMAAPAKRRSSSPCIKVSDHG